MKYKNNIILFSLVIFVIGLCILVIALSTSEGELKLNGSTGKELPYKNVDVIIQSNYGVIRVVDEGAMIKRRQIYINGGVMGGMNIRDKFETTVGWEYLDFMTEVSVESNPKDVLVLGVGAGIVPTRLSEQYRINVDAVDINKKVLEVAVKYFGMNPSESLKLYEQDARMFLRENDKKYDVIVMDIFKYNERGYVLPVHLVTQEYYQMIEDHLTEDGYLVLMLIENGEKDNFINSEYATLNSVFENVYVFNPIPLILIASNNPMEFSEKLNKLKHIDAINGGSIYTDNHVPIY